MELLLLARHGRSVFNLEGLVNGDPALDRGLAPEGRLGAEELARQLAGIAIDALTTSRFPRAQQTAALALGARAASIPHTIDTDLDDVRLGDLEGRTLEDYRAWKRGHRRDERFPGGESLTEAATRYATAFERLLRSEARTILCVCHEIPVRYAVNGAAGSDDLDHPLHDVRNATPYVFDAAGLERVVAGIRAAA